MFYSKENDNALFVVRPMSIRIDSEIESIVVDRLDCIDWF